MPSPAERFPLVVLVGPTASGKTALALDMAAHTGAEIISADSRLFYRGMDIGTAKPTPEERRRIPHHLIDFLNPDQTFSLGQFQQAVYRIAAEIRARSHLPLLVGGTGQYVRAVTEGWTVPAQQPDPGLRLALENQAARIGTDGLHSWLAHLDPEAAGAIDHRNLRRTVRALEVIFHTGRPFSEQRRAGEPHFRALLLGLALPRADLYDRIDRRIEIMFAGGFVDEVQGLLAAGYGPELPAMSAIGYKEVCRFIGGEISLEEARVEMKRRTRALVRRQANWFKSGDPRIRWLAPGEDPVELVERFIS